jgi:hypothetical protein
MPLLEPIAWRDPPRDHARADQPDQSQAASHTDSTRSGYKEVLPSNDDPPRSRMVLPLLSQ